MEPETVFAFVTLIAFVVVGLCAVYLKGHDSGLIEGSKRMRLNEEPWEWYMKGLADGWNQHRSIFPGGHVMVYEQSVRRLRGVEEDKKEDL